MTLNLKLLIRGALAITAGSTLIGGMSAAPVSAAANTFGQFTSVNAPIQELPDRNSKPYGYPSQVGEKREIICSTLGGKAVDHNVAPGQNAESYETWYRISAPESPTGTGYVPLANFLPDAGHAPIRPC